MSLRPKALAASAWSQGEQAAVDVERRLLEARMTRQAKEPAIAAGSCRLLARPRQPVGIGEVPVPHQEP